MYDKYGEALPAIQPPATQTKAHGLKNIEQYVSVTKMEVSSSGLFRENGLISDEVFRARN